MKHASTYLWLAAALTLAAVGTLMGLDGPLGGSGWFIAMALAVASLWGAVESVRPDF